MTWMDTLKGWFDKNSAKLVSVPIDPAQVNRQLSDAHAEVGKHYFRIRLAEMFLQKQVQFGSTWYPAVHALVTCKFNNQVENIPSIADATRVGMQQSPQGDVIAHNFILTPTLPFGGDVVTLDAGLLALVGDNHLNKLVGILSNIASLLMIPQFSQALYVARPLASGLQDLFGTNANSFHLGFHNAYSADQLKEGYIAVIRAPYNQVDTGSLWVVDDELREGTGFGAGQHKPYEKFDHMLFRIEVFENRDDWEQLSAISEPRQGAIQALGDNDLEKANKYMQRARLQAVLIPELTTADRRRVIEELNAEFEQNKALLGVANLVGEAVPTLDQVMRHAISADAALRMGEPTLDEIVKEEVS